MFVAILGFWGVNILVAILSVGIIIHIVIPLQKRRTLQLYCQQLDAMRFTTTKRIITADFAISNWADPLVGIWVDYDSRRLAIRTSHTELAPKIYDFSDIIGYGTMAPPSRKATAELAREIFVHIAFEGENVDVCIPLCKEPSGKGFDQYSATTAKKRRYYAFLNCRRAICDEIENIIKMNIRRLILC